jgi:hypothetical protein
VIGLFGAYITAQFGLVLPATAIGDERTLIESASHVRGNVWPLTLAVFIAWIGTKSVGWLVVFFASVMIGDLGMFGLTVTGLMSTFMQLLALVLSVGILSRAYVVLARARNTA